MSSWIEYFGCLIPRLSLVLAENRMSRRVEFRAMGSIYAIAGDVVEPSVAFLLHSVWKESMTGRKREAKKHRNSWCEEKKHDYLAIKVSMLNKVRNDSVVQSLQLQATIALDL